MRQKQLWKKVVSLMLVGCMAAGMLPWAVLAESGTEEAGEQTKTVLAAEEWEEAPADEEQRVAEELLDEELLDEDEPWCGTAAYRGLSLANEDALVAAYAAGDVVASGKCGTNVTWTLTQDGTLTIQGSGRMYDYWYTNDVPWGSQKVEIKSIFIEHGVTSIGEYAFWRCSSLTSITLPNSITSVGKGAFEWCSSLTSITLPNSITSIGEWAFW